MGEKDNYFWIGVFLVASVVGGVTLLMLVGGAGSDDRMERYLLSFSRDVSGLDVGAPVTYLGVRVGEVHSIRLSGGLHPRVEVDVEVAGSTPITSATYASLAYQGVTGVAVINLADDAEAPAEALASGAGQPGSIPTRDSGIAALLAEGPRISNRLNDLLLRSNALLADDNLARIEETLANLAAVSDAIAAQSNAIASVPAQAGELLDRSNRLAARLDDIAVSIGPELAQASGHLAEGSRELAALSATLREWQLAHSAAIEDALERGVGQLPGLVDDSRATLQNLNTLLERLERNPSRLIYRPRSDDMVASP